MIKDNPLKFIRNVIGTLWVPASFFCIELFMQYFVGANDSFSRNISLAYSILIGGVILFLPRLAGRIIYLLAYFPLALFACGQAACMRILGHMIWVGDITHLSEGGRYTGIISEHLTADFWLGLTFLLLVGIIGLFIFPDFRRSWQSMAIFAMSALTAFCVQFTLTDDCTAYKVSERYDAVRYRQTTNNYGIYSTFYSPDKVYGVCGYYKLLEQDIKRHYYDPSRPEYQLVLAEKMTAADRFYESRKPKDESGEVSLPGPNDMTGILEGKNVIMVLMESVDDFLVDEASTPTIYGMMREGINFSNFFTPIYSSIHTFNTEFCANTGYYLPTSGTSALYYADNDFSQSLPFRLRELGYTAKAFHYNSPVFYNRGVMLPAIGFDEYVCYEDYIGPGEEDQLLNELYPLENPEILSQIISDEPFYSYIITRNAHSPYSYDDELGAYALAQYPEYFGKYYSEPLDVMHCKSHAVDELFKGLLDALEASGHLEDTVIVGFTDHYLYATYDQESIQWLSGVSNTYMEMRTPCFIWGKDLQHVDCGKFLNTADLVPTLLNLLGMEMKYDYLGQDAFNEDYKGCVVFSDGAWIMDDVVYADGAVVEELKDGAAEAMDIGAAEKLAADFIKASDAMSEVDYYAERNR